MARKSQRNSPKNKMLQISKKCNTKNKSTQNLKTKQKYANSVIQIRWFCGVIICFYIVRIKSICNIKHLSYCG